MPRRPQPERMPSRHESTLSAPGPRADFSGFPQQFFAAGSPLRYRVHDRGQGHEPWWFASCAPGQGGRFDLPRPHGTLNTASTVKTAVREAFGHVLVGSRHLPETAVAGRVVSALALPEMCLADFTDAASVVHGIVPGDVSAPQHPDDGLTQQWAAAMHAAGHDGILARSRFGGGTAPTRVFVFGPAGHHVPEQARVVDEHPVRSVVVEMGHHVVATPASDELEILS